MKSAISILSFAISLACPSAVALAEGAESDGPGHVPGYEEAKKRANEGLSQPSAKDMVSLPQMVGEPMGPIFGGSFLGDTERFAAPPDLTIAAGRNHLVAVTNQVVQIFDKLGNLLGSPGDTLCGFFNQDGMVRCMGTDTKPATDPKVVYDERADRFCLTAVSVNNVPNPALRTSNILMGRSISGDPTAGWSLFLIDGMLEVNELGTRNSGLWCDYPQLGFDLEAIYLTCNMYSFTDGIVPPFFRYAKLRVMTKPQFIAGGPILWWDFFDGNLCEGLFRLGRSFTVQPAQLRGPQVRGGEFLVNSNSLFGNSLVVRRVTNVEQCCIPGAQSAPILETIEHGVGSYAIPRDARQTGDPHRIDTGDARLRFAVWQGGLLSTGQNLACGFLSGACVAFTELDVSGFPAITTVNDWVLSSPPEIDHFYPAVDVNAAGKKTMVFSRSGENDFASAAFVGIPSSSDCTRCTDGPERTLAQGGSTYVAGGQRWGDYSGAAADPDGVGIWIYGQFVFATDRWGGQFGLTQRRLFNPTPAISSISPSSSHTGVPPRPLFVNGADFMEDSVVRFNGRERPTTFISNRLLALLRYFR